MMKSGWQYRLASVLGVGALAIIAVAAANLAVVQSVFRLLPVVGRLPFGTATGMEFALEAGTTAAVVLTVLLPLYKPRPRRILDMALAASQRVFVALLGLATIGYFDYSYRLPRATLVVAGSILLLTAPAWFVLIRQRPRTGGERTIIVGDSPDKMDDILDVVDGDVLGYVSPPSAYFQRPPQATAPQLADGGTTTDIDDLSCLGGLSRLDEVLMKYDVGTVVLAFSQSDRAEFFGALDSCYEHGVAAKVHREHADVVLTGESVDGELVDIDLEPWDWQDRILKRCFDFTFAAVGLLALAPVLGIIAAAIKLDSKGPILYRQTRTAALGDTFTIAKFRTMVPDDESAAPTDDSETSRITRVGRFLRAVHLDEIPQLWAILTGKMSVVGPRAAWVEEENILEETVTSWRQRWFVKPGLTGLAQINDVSSTDPEEKLRYDVAYIRKQSFWFDLKIIIRQLWMVAVDVVGAVVEDKRE